MEDCKDRYGYIYITENLINGMRYIGQHKATKFDKSYKGSGKLLEKAFDKFGFDNFKTEIIEWVSSKEELSNREIYWIAEYDAVNRRDFYNLSFGGNPMLGRKHTPEAIQKMKQPRPHMRGKNNPMYGKPGPNLGKKMSESTKKKMSESHKGPKHHFYGKHHTEEFKKLLHEKNSGVNSPLYGKPKSEETKRKISEARKGMKMSSAKSIKCVETGIVFRCTKDAADYVGVKSPSNIASAARQRGLGNMKVKSYGYHWEYV